MAQDLPKIFTTPLSKLTVAELIIGLFNESSKGGTRPKPPPGPNPPPITIAAPRPKKAAKRQQKK